MKVNRTNFVKVLEKVAPALGFNVLVPEFQNFQFDGVKVQATDGALVIEAVLPEDTGLKCAVPGAPFLHLLRSLTDKEIQLIYEDGTLKVRTNKVKGVFTTLAVNIKKIINVSTTERLEHFSDILQGLSYCRFGVSKDETLGSCCGVQINNNVIFGTDRYRIIKWSLEKSYPIECSIPPKFIEVILRSRSEITALFYIKNSVFGALLKDGVYISTPILSGDYPDLLKYFPTSDNYREVKLVSDLGDILERHTDFLKNVNSVDKEISIRVLKNKCIITSTDVELGMLSEELEVVSDEEKEVEFNVNPVFLRDIVQECSGFKYYIDKRVILFEADHLKYLVQTRS